jgi:hypothetical protein
MFSQFRVMRYLTNFLLVSLLIILMSCARPFKQRSSTVYQVSASEEFNAGLLKQGGGAFIIATVPTGQEQYKNLLVATLAEAFEDTGGGFNLLSYRQSMSLININDLTQIFTKMLEDHEVSGILDKKALHRIGEALKVRYILQPELVNFTRTTNTRLSVFGLRLIQTEKGIIQAYLRIWDVGTGEIAWEGSGMANLAGEQILARPVLFEQTANLLWEELLSRLP